MSATSSTPLFSIIIPVNNVEAYLRDALDSVLRQAFTAYEVLLIDDGSSDGSADICLEYAKAHAQITLVRRAKTSTGPSEARNIGIQLARGEYLVFLDSDDFWLGDAALAEMAALIGENRPDLILHSYQLNEDGSDVGYYQMDLSELSGHYEPDFQRLVQRQIYRSSPWSKVVKRELVRQHQLAFPVGLIHEDSQWSFDIARFAQSYQIYNSHFYTYRRRSGSISYTGNIHRMADFLSIIERNLYALGEVRRQRFTLYAGLFNYLAREMFFLNSWLNDFPPEEQALVQKQRTRCQQLFDFFKQDFTPTN